MDTTIDHPSEATSYLPDNETLLAILPSAGPAASAASEHDSFAGDDEDDELDADDSDEDEEDDREDRDDEDDDEVDEASEESFPASDPPAFTPLHIGVLSAPQS
jgi:hypothetical protein